MRGLLLDNLTGLVGDVFKGVANSTARMKESVLFHNGEEEKKYKQMEERKNKEVAKLTEDLKERDKQVEERNKLIKAKEEELRTREEKAKEDDAKHKEEVAKLKAEVEERNKQIAERNKQVKAKEDELKTMEERAKEDEAKYKEEVAKLKSEVEETNKQVEETNKQIKAKEKELKTKEEKIDKFKKQLEYKDGIIRELRTNNAGLKAAFDLNAGVILQMEDLAAKEEAANLKAATFKRSRQELEETTGPAVKKVCLAVKQLGSKKQEVVANGLQVIEASAKIIGPAVAQSKNKKRREERGRSKKGNQYCGFCKDFFRLDL